jgi:ribonuclease HI
MFAELTELVQYPQDQDLSHCIASLRWQTTRGVLVELGEYDHFLNDACVDIRRIFTDGGCLDNGMVIAIGGVGVFFSPDSDLNYSARQCSYEGLPSNQRGELEAILIALHIAINQGWDRVCLYSDSEYAINCVTKWHTKWLRMNWLDAGKKRVAHADLIRSIINLKSRIKVRFAHVRSHQEEPADHLSIDHLTWLGNKNADILATDGMSKQIDEDTMPIVLDDKVCVSWKEDLDPDNVNPALSLITRGIMNSPASEDDAKVTISSISDGIRMKRTLACQSLEMILKPIFEIFKINLVISYKRPHYFRSTY